MSVFHIHDLSFLARTQRPGLTITMDTILAGSVVYTLADVSAVINLDLYPLSHSYNVYTDNSLDPVSDPPNYIPTTASWVATIQPDVLSFHDGLPA